MWVSSVVSRVTIVVIMVGPLTILLEKVCSGGIAKCIHIHVHASEG